MTRKPFVFTSKADTLLELAAYPELAIPPLMAFTWREWRTGKAVIAARAAEIFCGALVAVRSSCRKEDSEASSGAGAYLSLLNVASGDEGSLSRAIDQVFASYGQAEARDQVIIQAMIVRPQVTGVIMTRSLADGAPYYVINYDDESGATDTVTGGSRISKVVHVYRDARDEDFDSPRLHSFVSLARRLEELCDASALDVEFCLDADNVLHLLQVRPICAQKNWAPNIDSVGTFINHIGQFIQELMQPAPDVLGQRTILGVMPDWNPAEMIGIFPRPLASSLYRHLITSRVWSSARRRMGYRAIPEMELMPLIMGRPYIDVRASFNSLLPQGLDDVTGEALVEAWLDRLQGRPQLHDKVEFEVAQTALDFCFEENLDKRYPGLLTRQRRKDFRRHLRHLTDACLDMTPEGTLSQALERITELRGRQAGRSLTEPQPLFAINSLLQECRKYGTLPFSILARHAFIAEAMLRTAIVRGAMHPERLAQFKLSVRTISGELSRDFRLACSGQMDPAHFLRKYGHLRPGSYDILSPRYVDRDNLFQQELFSQNGVAPEAFLLTSQEKSALAALLRESGLGASPEHLLAYAAQAIAGRELGKFIFTRNLSDILETIARWGERLGFSRDDCSYLDVQAVLDHTVNVWPEPPSQWFRRHMEVNRNMRAQAQMLKLGYLIRSVRDVYIAPQHQAAPNFIGHTSITANVISLRGGSDDAPLSGKIVCIESADPGFDWIFTRNIGALVTKFGGANSHMAIRCAEYGLPAAIGVGEALFERISAASAATLDPRGAILKAR